MNLAHLQELLEENEQIQVKRETLRSWAHEIHHVKRAKRRRTKARKRRERMESPGLLLLSAVPVIVIAVFSEPFPDLAGLSPAAIVAMTYLILFPMSYCQWAYFKTVSLLPASVAAIGTLMVPAIGVYSSYLILGEYAAAGDIIALLLVLSALVLVLLIPAWKAAGFSRV